MNDGVGRSAYRHQHAQRIGDGFFRNDLAGRDGLSHQRHGGPATGLASIVVVSIHELGSFQAFLLSVTIAGILQLILGYFRAGAAGHFFPVSVIKGMLAAIGIILILKQIYCYFIMF